MSFNMILSVTYDEINESNTFTNGDCISGHVTLDVTKKTKIKSFRIKLKGKIKVQWRVACSRGIRPSSKGYDDEETLIKSVQYFVGGDLGTPLLTDHNGQPYSNTITPGRHLFPFTFDLPQEKMPPSFKGVHGKIVYFLEAKLTRLMRISSKDRIEFTFVPKPNPSNRVAQDDFTDKSWTFQDGIVSNIKAGRKCHLGEGLTVTGTTQNTSSSPVRLNFRLCQVQECCAQNQHWSHDSQDVLIERSDIIGPFRTANVTEVLKIPCNIPASLLNCRLMKVEYKLWVYLEGKHSFDSIVFGVELLPPRQEGGQSSFSEQSRSTSQASQVLRSSLLCGSPLPADIHHLFTK
ncbi:arrestin domain-containing protein 3-like isoform X1 [Alosa sapidissima]|uniref:arrestin domain-containing protein 3-like isoform X1 n=1 Tax=Alosa sapidissima TaxID=34773 RepID=UPI001C08B7C9|nr:arrestin domain-containing protein 3-like isoform X1 [Alosa sapidissima]